MSESRLIETVAEFLDCPYRDAVDPGLHSGCSWCANVEPAVNALAELRALLIEADSAISHLYYRKTWPLDQRETDVLISKLRNASK